MVQNFKINLYKVKKTFKEEGLNSVIHKVNKKIHLKKNSIKEKYRKKDVKFKKTLIQHNINNNESAMFTIVSKNYMHYALSVRESFLQNNKDTSFYIFLMDKLTTKEEIEIFQELNEHNIQIIGFEEIESKIDSLLVNKMLFKYTILEMNTGVKPFAMEYLLNIGFEKVIYIDPDICFYQPITEILSSLDKYDILLTPHILEPYFDQKSPSELDIMKGGVYNLGFIAVKNTKNVISFTHWWQERLSEYGYSDIKNGMFTDQKWMDLTPSLFHKVCIFKDPGHNVAYWNLHERNMEFNNGIWYVNDKPLVFFHYSGLPLHDIVSISKHQNRFNINDVENIKSLIFEYINLVKSFAPDRFKDMEYYYSNVSGTKYKYLDFLRTLDELSLPYLPCKENFKQIVSYFKHTSVEDISIFERSYWNARDDLQNVFPDIETNKESRSNFKNWILHEKAYHISQFQQLDQIEQLSNKDSLLGLNLIGYHSSIIGVAEAGRLFMQKAAYSSIPLSLYNINSEYHAQLNQDELNGFSSKFAKDPMFHKNIFFINADQINNVHNFFPHLFQAKYNVAVWWWEFDNYFSFVDSFKYLNEVIVFTDFVKKAIEKVTPSNIKLRKMTYPFVKNWDILQSSNDVRRQLGLNEEDFIFMYAFDMFSGFERKNPLALIEAFSNAFRKQMDIKLILKIGHAANFQDEKKKLLNLIEKNGIQEQVIILEDALTRNELMTLVNAADCYISLHRSEGLGLGMLEAMYLGKPVIATNYGGNLEFMNSENSLLVDYTLVPLENDFGPYKKGWLWANPDVTHASSLMEKVVYQKDYAKKLGAMASSSVKKQFANDLFSTELYNFLLES